MARKSSTLDRLKQLDDERAKLLKGAKAEAMAKVHTALSELNALGFSYRVSEGKPANRFVAAPVAAPKSKKRAMKNEPCPICGFKTSPLHDRRAHRGQESKKPFSPSELSEREMRKL